MKPKGDLTRAYARLRRRLGPMDQETRAEIRGYRIARREGYTEIRDCRIIAMAYAMGWMNGRRSKP